MAKFNHFNLMLKSGNVTSHMMMDSVVCVLEMQLHNNIQDVLWGLV